MVNGEPVSEKEWADTCKRVAGSSILRVMVNHLVVRQAAQARGIVISDADAAAEFDKAVSRAGGLDNLLAGLSESGESAEDFKNRLRTNMLLNKLVEKDVTVTDDEVRRFFLERYGRKAEVQVIVGETLPDAESAYGQLQKGKDFPSLAAEASVDSLSAENHGYLPALVSDGFFPKPFGRVVVTESIANMLFGMKPGEVSKPIQGEGGFYLFKVTRQDPASSISFDSVKDQVKAAALERKRSTVAQQYLEQLLAKSDIRLGIELQ
jgi:foldase protein PrsA